MNETCFPPIEKRLLLIKVFTAPMPQGENPPGVIASVAQPESKFTLAETDGSSRLGNETPLAAESAAMRDGGSENTL